MDRIRTLLLARTNVVVMDADLVASASTRPTRDRDIEQLEDDLAQLGYVMSLDLATMIRRLPSQTMLEMRDWIQDTLANQVGTHRPHVPLTRPAVENEAQAPYARRMLAWLVTKPEQPCPWCGETKRVGALDPCGHLVCRSCWQAASFAGCPICHRRIAVGDPFMAAAEPGERVTQHTGSLTLIDLGFDLVGIARKRFVRLVGRLTPLSPADRAEVETVIDAIGPNVVGWLPERIPIRETMAVVVARLVLISPDRAAMMRDMQAHVLGATDVLRIAAVLMGASAELTGPMRFRSLARGLRRALLETLERLPLDGVVEDMLARQPLWKRVGEFLHPFEYVDRLPNTAIAFAVVRGTDLAKVSFGAPLRERAVQRACVYVEDNRIKGVAWAGPIEDALRVGNPRSALARLTHRPEELLRRADHLVRMAQTHQIDALQTILKAIDLASAKAPPATMLTLASHIARRGRSWPRRVFVPHGDLLHGWGTADQRAPLRGDAIAMIVGSVRRHLIARADTRRQFPRALIDRALVDLVIPMHERTASRGKLAWPRGSEIAVPAGELLRLFLHWEEPVGTPVDLDLEVVLFDQDWRHVGTCDAKQLVVGDDAAVHAGNQTSAAPPLGASEYVDLHLDRLAMLGARHLVMVVARNSELGFDRLTHAFAGVMPAPAEGQYFDARSVDQRFDLHGAARIMVPLAIDLAERRLRWLDVHIRGRKAMQAVGGYRAALAHIGRDAADALGTQARPTLWDLACVHAAARGNVIYIRERDGSFSTYRRRDNENKVTRLARLLSGTADDGRVAALPVADAPTWFALVTGVPLPRGSVGYALDGRHLGHEILRLAAADLVAELTRS